MAGLSPTGVPDEKTHIACRGVRDRRADGCGPEAEGHVSLQPERPSSVALVRLAGSPAHLLLGGFVARVCLRPYHGQILESSRADAWPQRRGRVLPSRRSIGLPSK